jgi:hypothetical protein
MLLAPDRTEPGAYFDGVAALAFNLEVAIHMFLPLVPSPSGTATAPVRHSRGPGEDLL